MNRVPTIIIDFERFLQDEYFEDNADLMILDDDMPDAFDNYLSNVTYQDIYQKAEKFYQQRQPVLVKMMGEDFTKYFDNPVEQLTKEYAKSEGIEIPR